MVQAGLSKPSGQRYLRKSCVTLDTADAALRGFLSHKERMGSSLLEEGSNLPPQVRLEIASLERLPAGHVLTGSAIKYNTVDIVPFMRTFVTWGD